MKPIIVCSVWVFAIVLYLATYSVVPSCNGNHSHLKWYSVGKYNSGYVSRQCNRKRCNFKEYSTIDQCILDQKASK